MHPQSYLGVGTTNQHSRKNNMGYTVRYLASISPEKFSGDYFLHNDFFLTYRATAASPIGLGASLKRPHSIINCIWNIILIFGVHSQRLPIFILSTHTHYDAWRSLHSPPFLAGLWSDSVGLDLFRMPNFWLWNCWNSLATFWQLSGACLPDW